MEKLKKEISVVLDLYRKGKLLKAESLCKKLVNTYPQTVFLYNLLGLILSSQKKINEAISVYQKGIKIDPNYAMIYNNLGSAYKFKEDYKLAEKNYKKSIELDNKIVETHNNFGNLLVFLNRFKEGIFSYKEAIKINQNFFVAHYNLGIAYKTIGKAKEAINSLKKAIALNTNFYTAHRNLSQLITYNKDSEHFKILRKIYENSNKSDFNKTELSFALGKAFEDLKDYKESFKYYKEGNDLRRKQINFSMSKEKEDFDNIKEIFTYQIFKIKKKLNKYNIKPIFIVGMPRSGTTLVEQIISSHPKVFPGDELPYLQNISKEYFYTSDKFDHKKINENNINIAANDYISKLKKISNNKEIVTDKLPVNFKLIGLIKLILPNSKIIHCVRSPRDVCLSIFKNYFVNRNLNFSYNLEEIVDYYILYTNLMNYWKKVLPNFVFDIRYEELISKPENNIRNLIKYCDLKWSQSCMKFYNNERPIRTASDTQARKKIYKTSIKSWVNFKDDLNSLFARLPN